MTGKKCTIPPEKCVISCDMLQNANAGDKKGLSPQTNSGLNVKRMDLHTFYGFDTQRIQTQFQRFCRQ